MNWATTALLASLGRRHGTVRRAPHGHSVALAALLLVATTASGQAPGSGLPLDDPSLLTVRSNGVVRGELGVLARPDGDFWLLLTDAGRLQARPSEQAMRAVGDKTYLSLRALGATLAFDETQLTLSVDFPAAGLEGTAIDLGNRPPPVQVTEPATSLIMSYRLATRTAGQSRATSFVGDVNVRVGPLLLRQEARLDTALAPGLARGQTQAIYDLPAHATRITVGDVFSTAGAYGVAVTGAGILVRKQYEMTPDVIRQPTANLQASTALPAEVRVDVDGSTVYRGTVGPGPLAINNLLAFGGTRDIRITITDAAGRRQVIQQPFLFTTLALARGLHDYSYFVGRRSELGEDLRWRYKELGWQAFHRYGVTDSVTVGAGGEGSVDFTTAGAGVTLRSDVLGLVSLDLLANRQRAAPDTARGASLQYLYALPDFTLSVGRRVVDRDFRTFTPSSESLFPRTESRVGVGTRLWGATVSADVLQAVTTSGINRSAALRTSTQVGRAGLVSFEVRNDVFLGFRSRSATVSLRWNLDPERWVGANIQSASLGRSASVEAGKNTPSGEGVGYRMNVARDLGAADTGVSSVAANWNLKPVTLEYAGSVGTGAAAGSFHEVAVSGAVVALGGYWGLTRRVTDSFALARLGVKQAGVDISVNNQRQGSTDASGQLFIPQVGSFSRQEISLDDRQLPVDYTLQDKRRAVAPAFRSGVIVDFGARRMQGVAGRAWLLEDGRRMALANQSLLLLRQGTRIEVETTRLGDFYLEDAIPGLYRGQQAINGQPRDCRLVIPLAGTEAIQELPGRTDL